MNPMRYVYIIIITVLLASCSSSRKAAKAPMIGGLTGEAYIEKVIELAPAWQSLSGKVALDLFIGRRETCRSKRYLTLEAG